MTVPSGAPGTDAADSGRGERTRALILDASQRLFLQRGYAGTPINAITEACGISRAGFYTYFKDKREVFNVLGETVYHDGLEVIKNFPKESQRAAVRGWVGDYFRHLDRHGAFIVSAQHSAPDDEAFRRSRDLIMTRSSFTLGQAIASDEGSASPEAVGAVVIGLLERTWYTVQAQSVRIDRAEAIDVTTDVILSLVRSKASVPMSSGFGSTIRTPDRPPP